MSSTRFRFGFTLVAASLLFSQAGCRARTQLMLGVITDLRAPDALDEVEMVVRRDGQEVLRVPWSLPGVPGQPYILPGSYGVYTEDGSEPQIAISVTGLRNGEARVERRALVSLVREQTLFLRLGLVAGCVQKSDCGADETCVEGVCKPVLVDARRLPKYEVDMERFVDCQSGTTYVDTGTQQPVPTRAGMGTCKTPGSFCEEATCYLPIPDEPDLGAPDLAIPDDLATPADLAPVLYTEEEVPAAAIGRRITSVFAEPGTSRRVWAVGEGGLLMQRTYFTGPMTATAWTAQSIVDADAGAAPDFRTLAVPPESMEVWVGGANTLGYVQGGVFTPTPLPRATITVEAIVAAGFPFTVVGRDSSKPAGMDGVVLSADFAMVIEDTSFGERPALHAAARLSSGTILVAGDRGAILSRDPQGGTWTPIDARFLGTPTTVSYTSMAVDFLDTIVVGTSDGRVLVMPPGAANASSESRFSTSVAAVWIGDATRRIYAASVDGRIDSRPVTGGAWVTEPDIAPRALTGLTVITDDLQATRVVAVGAGGLVWSAPGKRETLPANPPPAVQDGGTPPQCFPSVAGQFCANDCECFAPLTCTRQSVSSTTGYAQCCASRGTATLGMQCVSTCDCDEGDCAGGVCSMPR